MVSPGSRRRGCRSAKQPWPTTRPGPAIDNGRAIVYAQLGRNEEAAIDLAAYVTWVKATYPDLFAKFHGPEAERWQAELEAGRNPFDDPVLAKLRQG